MKRHPQNRGTPFLPATRDDMVARDWDQLDVILVTGDAYIDAPSIGVALIGRVLEAAGHRVGIIAQPDVTTAEDIMCLGEPRLFWGVTAGCIDSMVANRTASGRPRKQDDYTPGGAGGRRPDRAAMVYSHLIRRHFKQTVPIVLGGVEASLRRLAHYDFWSNRVRKSILFDAKADYLLYGMADRSVRELAARLDRGEPVNELRGLCYVSPTLPAGALELPSFVEVKQERKAFNEMFVHFYRNNDPVTATMLAQQQDTRYLVQNPPAPYLEQEELDAVHALPFALEAHPRDARAGEVRALDTIRFSITTHRGCYGECNFCAIAVHQGRRVRWRSHDSILAEARRMVAHEAFKGTICDVGGPTANMYGFECARKATRGACPGKRCLTPDVCKDLKPDHRHQLTLLKDLRAIPGVRRVIVASGLRYDLILADARHGEAYLDEVVRHHVSGQMKVAPEHTEDHVLKLMGKPGQAVLRRFRDLFVRLTARAGKDQYLTYYFIAAHPGCTEADMRKLKAFTRRELKVRPRQVQIFTPTPSTASTAMYWTGRDPFTDQPCTVDTSPRGRERQKAILTTA